MKKPRRVMPGGALAIGSARTLPLLSRRRRGRSARARYLLLYAGARSSVAVSLFSSGPRLAAGRPGAALLGPASPAAMELRTELGRISTSTRRFCARPPSVALLA